MKKSTFWKNLVIGVLGCVLARFLPWSPVTTDGVLNAIGAIVAFNLIFYGDMVRKGAESPSSKT